MIYSRVEGTQKNKNKKEKMELNAEKTGQFTK